MKRSEQTVELSINTTPEAAWDVIGAVTGVEKWFGAMIKGSRLEGSKNRVCTIDGGVEFKEDILKIDNENMEFKYGIPEQPMMPVENIIGNMKVSKGTDGNAVVRWHWTFDVAEENEAQAKEMLAGAGNVGIKGIEELINSQVVA